MGPSETVVLMKPSTVVDDQSCEFGEEQGTLRERRETCSAVSARVAREQKFPTRSLSCDGLEPIRSIRSSVPWLYGIA
jgi:hypothetical protein